MVLSYKKAVILLVVPFMLNGATLKEIMNLTLKRSETIKSLNYDIKSKEQALKSVSNIYSPTLSAGANHTRVNLDRPVNVVGATTTGFLKFDVTLYDGDKNLAQKRTKKSELRSAKFSKDNSIKEILLQEISLFYQIRSIKQSIEAYKEKSKSLYAEYKREKEKYDIKMVTKDEVLKLKSEYESNRYIIDELKYQKESLLETLSLLCGKKISSVDDSKIKELKSIAYKPSSAIKALRESIKVADENIKLAKALKKPKVKIEDTLSAYGYSNYNDMVLKDLPDMQNRVSLSFNIVLFDTLSSAKKESAILAKMAKKEQLNYAVKKEKSSFKIAYQKLLTQKRKIASAKSALITAKSTYDIIKTKFQNGIVDNITYLDALSKMTLYSAQYHQALNEYEIAKANLYFSSGLEYKEILKLIF